ncbi:MAG: hypothetical protein OCD76_24570 [Reichenbachiella sp.]
MNDINAEENQRTRLLSLAIFIGGTICLFIYILPYISEMANIYAISGFVGILTIPFLVYQGINSTHSGNVRYFNSKKYG